MFKNSCRCCLTQNKILLPLETTASSHDDGKTLWDYFKSILPTLHVQTVVTPYFICLRCSKALQVSYHFIKMNKETEQIIINRPPTTNSKDLKQVVVGKTFVKQVQEEISLDERKSENQLQFEDSNTDENQCVNIIPTDTVVLSNTSSSLNKNCFCEICKKHFENKQNLLDHNEAIHKELIPYKCKMCNFYSCYTESIFKHYKLNHKLTSVELKLRQTKDFCEFVKENPKFEILYKCLKCNFESENQATLDDHQLENHCINEDNDCFTTEMFKCPSCCRSFKALKSAKIHYTMYHSSSLRKNRIMNNKNHSCDKCGALFDLKSGLMLHKRICDYKEAVNCNFCKLKFSTLLKYEQHLQSQHMVAIKHECEVCGKVFSCSEYLAIHRKRHNERYYQCDLCSKNYINNAELKIHKQRTHNKLLSQLASANANKKMSKTTHNGGYQCTYCDFVTNTRFSLKVHQNVHTGKPYKCRLCSKKYVHRQDLKQHCKRLHSVSISNEELADMFKQTYGYTSRFDAFSKQNNNLEIPEIKNLELDKELDEFGLTLEDIMKDLFVGEIMNNK